MHFAIVGIGGFGREVMDWARLAVARQCTTKPTPAFYFVNNTTDDQEQLLGHACITFDAFQELPGPKEFSVAIADTHARRKIAEELRQFASPATLVADNAYCSSTSEVGEGAILCPFSMITSNARIGRHFHANIYSYVAHDCVLGDYVTLAPKACINGNVHVGDGAYIGTGAIIRQGKAGKTVVIGAKATIGMGAVVTKDVPAGVTVIGNPARILPAAA